MQVEKFRDHALSLHSKARANGETSPPIIAATLVGSFGRPGSGVEPGWRVMPGLQFAGGEPMDWLRDPAGEPVSYASIDEAVGDLGLTSVRLKVIHSPRG